jgi:hypothetical protein
MAIPTCPLSGPQVVELYFMEHRAKLLDLAAFLDRLDRAGLPTGNDDVRVRALRRAIPLLLDGTGDRVRRILELLSDHTTAPIAVAHAFSFPLRSPTSDALHRPAYPHGQSDDG